MKVYLCSLPFFDVGYPHSGLGALQPYLLHHEPTWQVDVELAHMELASWDPVLYKALAANGFEGELLYASLAYPDNVDALARAWSGFPREGPLGEYLAARRQPAIEVVNELRVRLDQHLDDIVAARSWDGVLVGLTTTSQLFANLLLAQRIKSVGRDVTVVLGGPTVSPAAIADSVLETFPWVDYIIRGEGELPLLGLARHIAGGKGSELPRGVASRDHPASAGGLSQVADLDSLPYPSYDVYFRTMSFLSDAQNYITVEGSRGCWWDRTTRDVKSTCKFCNLNVQWDGYRQKSADRVAREIQFLSDRYRQTKFSFVDNIVRIRGFDDFVEALGAVESDIDIFHEARANLRPDDILRFHAVGLRQVQFGLEALSNSLLRRINKGTTVIANLEVMKTCAELGIDSHSNLILSFPGSTQAEVDETMQVIDEYAFAYQPTDLAHYELGIDSVVARFPEVYGVTNVRNHDRYAEILPADVLARLVTFQFSFDDGATADWSPLMRLVSQWHRWSKRGNDTLTYQDGGDFTRVRRARSGFAPQTFVLTGVEAELYRLCHRIRRRREIDAAMADRDATPEAITAALERFTEQRIMYRDGDKFLSLAMAPDAFMAAQRIRRQAPTTAPVEKAVASASHFVAAERVGRRPEPRG